jgi:hypothetical protein
MMREAMGLGSLRVHVGKDGEIQAAVRAARATASGACSASS